MEEIKTQLEEIFEAKTSELKEDVRAEIAADVEKMLEKEREKREKKLGAYHPDAEDENEAKMLRIRKALKEVANGNKKVNKDFPNVSKKNLTTSEPDEIVDTEISFEILNVIEEYGVARELFRNHQLTKNKYRANELDADISVAWVDEGEDIDASTFSVTENVLELEKLAALAIMSNELLEDSEINIENFLMERVGELFAKEEDEVFLAGDSNETGVPVDGLLYVDSVEEYQMETGEDSVTDMDADDLLFMQEELPSTSRDAGVYVMSFSVFNHVRTLKDNDDRYIYQHIADEGPDTIWGKPVVVAEGMPEKDDVDPEESFLLFGDFDRGAVLGYKGGIRVDSAMSGYVKDSGNSDVRLFQSDRQAIRFIERVGYVHVLEDTIVRLKTGATS